jgi:hypothetical protein
MSGRPLRKYDLVKRRCVFAGEKYARGFLLIAPPRTNRPTHHLGKSALRVDVNHKFQTAWVTFWMSTGRSFSSMCEIIPKFCEESREILNTFVTNIGSGSYLVYIGLIFIRCVVGK